jgi:hypothetical protein
MTVPITDVGIGQARPTCDGTGMPRRREPGRQLGHSIAHPSMCESFRYAGLNHWDETTALLGIKHFVLAAP